MKFRMLFFLFNLVILVAFALVVFMPLIVLGSEYSQAFWAGNWPMVIVFVVVLAGLNVYFGVNWRLFQLLEREDWPGLIEHLEQIVLERGRVTRQRLRILVNALVVTGSSARILELETRFRAAAPEWLRRFPVEFSVPYLLGNDAPGLERFSDEMMNDPRCPEQIWVRFNHSFALLLQRRTHEARSGFLAFAGERMDAVQQLLTGYVLDTIAEEEDREIVRQLRDRFTSGRPEEKWKRELERDRANLQVLVLTKLIADATNWVYGREVARAER